jgi:hypothetical protein
MTASGEPPPIAGQLLCDIDRLLAVQDNTEEHHDRLLVMLRTLFEANAPTELLLRVCEAFRHVYVDAAVIRCVDEVILHRRRHVEHKRVVASLDPLRPVSDDEVVICYGEYPYMVENLAHTQQAFRHVRFFWDTAHDDVEYDERAWAAVDQIYVINLPHRLDRWLALLAELVRVRAPLHKVTRVDGVDNAQNPSLGCADSHLAVARMAMASGFTHVLVLEDDFTFIDHRSVSQALATFFTRGYDYDVCLLATSRFFRRVPKDDLIEVSHQECTTASGYLVSHQAWPEIVRLWEHGRSILADSGDLQYACDRTWAPLQSRDRFYVFRKKLGFQRTSYSTISKAIVDPMD